MLNAFSKEYIRITTIEQAENCCCDILNTALISRILDELRK